MKKVIVFCIVAILLSGCAPYEPGIVKPEQRQDREGFIGSFAHNDIGRIVDREAGVVCWVADGYEAVSIDCLPISETRLDE